MRLQEPNPIEIAHKLETISQKFNHWYQQDTEVSWGKQRNFLTKQLIDLGLLEHNSTAAFWKAFSAIIDVTDAEYGDPYNYTGMNQRSYFDQLVWWCQSPMFHTKKWDFVEGAD